MASALDGIRILDFGRIQQGPFAGVLLSDMGADVIKVEEPGGEARTVGSQGGGFSGMFEANNRGKKSITVNLRDEAGQGVIKRLAPSVDVMLENFRAGGYRLRGHGVDHLYRQPAPSPRWHRRAGRAPDLLCALSSARYDE